MAPVSSSELRDDIACFNADFYDLPILTQNQIMNRYREDPACITQKYRIGTDIAKDTQSSSSPYMLSWIYTTSAYDSMMIQIDMQEWDEKNLFYVCSSSPQDPESYKLDAFELAWNSRLKCYKPVPALPEHKQFFVKHPNIMPKRYFASLTCAYSFVSYLHILATTITDSI